jgi:hypothetical protein
MGKSADVDEDVNRRDGLALRQPADAKSPAIFDAAC